jgi:crotonobetainyl-CoA:carnitine CoA-transferase CaiB-like acyl-CoA transferase
MDSKLTDRCTDEASSKSLEIFSKQSQGKYERACDRIGLGEKSKARLLLPDHQRVLAHAALEAEIHQAFEKFPRWSVLDFGF